MRSPAALLLLLLLAAHGCHAGGPPADAEVTLARDTTKTPASSAESTVAETKKEHELFSWLRDKAGLSQAVIDKSKAKLSEEDVDSLEALQALNKLGGLASVFSPVPAQQVADALAAAAAPEVRKNPWETGEPGHWDTVTGEWVPDAPSKKAGQNVTRPAVKKNPWETGEPGHWDTVTGEWVPDPPSKKAGQNVTGPAVKKNPWETGEPGHWDTVTGEWVPDAPPKGAKGGAAEGRCGPLFNKTRCDCSRARWAVFCVSANGWCGDSAEHAHADEATEYDCPLELRRSEPAEGRCGPLFDGARCDCSKDASFKFCNSENGWCGDTAEHASADAFTKYDCRSVAADVREAQDRRARRSSGRQIRLLGDTTTSQDAHEVRVQGLEDRCQAAGRRCQEATLPISADTEKACSLAAACRLQEAESRERKAAGGGSAPAATGIRGERLRYEQENRQGTLNPS